MNQEAIRKERRTMPAFVLFVGLAAMFNIAQYLTSNVTMQLALLVPIGIFSALAVLSAIQGWRI
ncbi:hypothetical protein [Nocardia brasiliensis]|uniref:hypothetical protein n=1 Tax=Nocardia brasiliensis TaxID=37326 RepID=UPI002457CF38|nr:hypothetical protein [Nocardia brasiliensis]